MLIFPQNVDLALALAMWERQRGSLHENENSMSIFIPKRCFLTKILICRWKKVGLEPTGAFYITFYDKNYDVDEKYQF